MSDQHAIAMDKSRDFDERADAFEAYTTRCQWDMARSLLRTMDERDALKDRVKKLETALRKIAEGAPYAWVKAQREAGDDVLSDDYYIMIARKALSEEGE